MQGPETPEVSSAGPAASPRGDRRDPEGRSTRGFESGTLRPVTLLAALVGLSATLGLGIAAGATTGTLLVAGSAVGFALATPAMAAEDPVRIAVGVALGILSAFGVAIGTVLGPPRIVLALALAAFGSAAVPAGSLGDGRLTEGIGTMLYALLPIGVVGALSILVEGYGSFVDGTLGALGSGGPGQDLFTASLLFVAASIGTLVAVRTIPFVRLAPKSDRERIRDRVVAIEHLLYRCSMVAGLSVVAAIGLWMALESDAGSVRPTAEFLGGVAGSAVVQVPLVAIAGLGIVTAVSVFVLRGAGGSFVELTGRGVAMAVGVGLAAVLVAVHGPLYGIVLDSVGPNAAAIVTDVAGSAGRLTAVVGGVLLLAVGFVVVALVLPAAVGMGLAPDRAAAAAFGAAGLVGASILAADSVGAPLVFGGVVAGMVVWDLGEFGVGVAEEVGVESAPRAETVHALSTVLVGGLVAAGATIAHGLATGVRFRGAPALAAVAIVFVGVVLLVSVVRG